MAELTDPQKLEIVEALACFGEPASIISRFRSVHGLDLTHKQVGRYDPTRPYFEAGDKWRQIFQRRREAYLQSVATVPIAHQGYRLNMLQEGVDWARRSGNWILVARLLEQAAKEVGGASPNHRAVGIKDERRSRIADMSPDSRRTALADVIRQAIESAPARLATTKREAA